MAGDRGAGEDWVRGGHPGVGCAEAWEEQMSPGVEGRGPEPGAEEGQKEQAGRRGGEELPE